MDLEGWISGVWRAMVECGEVGGFGLVVGAVDGGGAGRCGELEIGAGVGGLMVEPVRSWESLGVPAGGSGSMSWEFQRFRW